MIARVIFGSVAITAALIFAALQVGNDTAGLVILIALSPVLQLGWFALCASVGWLRW